MSDSKTHQNSSKESPPELPDLELVRLVGSGAYGRVWLANNQITRRLVAVKVIPLHPINTNSRAVREISSLIRYEASFRSQHENLLAIHHVGQTEELLFYLMDPADDVSGRSASLDPNYRPASLAMRMEVGPLPLSDCIDYVRQLLAGLSCLHNAGLVHRDIKPSNCLFVAGKLKLADFGLLTQADGTLSKVGTPPYMPPDGQMDSRADVYAMGLVLYEMFTGLPASCFPRLSPKALGAGDEAIIATLNKLILRACETDRLKRFKNGGEMLRALEGSITKMQPKYRRNVRRLAFSTVFVTAVLVLTALWLRQPRTQHIDVNFITVPFEAEIYLDGTRVVDPQGRPYTTPCTILGLPARTRHTVFKLDGFPDLEVGHIDFLKEREVVATWKRHSSP